jgi:carboxyl-terminal processing protease
VQNTYRLLKQNYDGTLDDAKLIEGANRGLVEAAGDDYTQYFNPEESKQFSDDLTGSIGGGIGIELAVRNQQVTVARVLADNPGAAAGLLAGDIVVSINDETKDWTVDEVVSKVRGEAGTTVKMKVLRGTETKDFTITRAEINNPSVYSSVENGVGLLTISRFDDQTGSLARQAAQSFKDQNVKGVIVDLRGNGGGYITAAQDVAGIWLNKQIVVSERVNGKVEEELKTGGTPILEGVPTVLLVNGGSASASEIVAGALQEYGVATLIGETTFGKGSVQKLVSLPGGAELKVTVARWYTPQGKTISEKGITPNTVVERSADDVNANRDPQLDAAKQKLSS